MPDTKVQWTIAPASFSDLDNNTWLLQEIKTRFPGRGFSNLDDGTLTGLLREAEEHHGQCDRPLSPGVDQVLDRWFAEHERGDSFFELAIRLRYARVLPKVLRP